MKNRINLMSTKDEFSTNVSKALEVYCNNSTLRMMITSIPYVGNYLDLFFSTKGQKIVQDRIMFLLDQLQSEVNKIDENSINKDFLESEEFFDLLIKTFEAAVRTKHHEKIQFYAKILLNSVINHNCIKYEPEDYLNILSELSLQELELAKIIYTSQNGVPRKDDESILAWAHRCGWDDIIHSYSTRTEDIVFLLKRLERSGLITVIVGLSFGDEGLVYVITARFRKMMRFISEAGSEIAIVEGSEK